MVSAASTATDAVAAGSLPWLILGIIVIGSIVFDLLISRRKSEQMTFRQAAWMTLFWIALAGLFNLGVYIWQGSRAALEFLTGYLVEYALSVDNLFLFMVLFSFFGVWRKNQRIVLFWGIFFALVCRGVFLIGGVALMHRFHWLIYAFGLILILTAYKLAVRQETEDADLEKSWVVRFCRRVLPLPVTPGYEGEKFFIRREGRLMVTPLFLVLMVVELVDVMFALDSIPAILAISSNEFVVYSSNAFAILGLRALFFVINHLLGLFQYLNRGLAVILAFIGVKMLLSDVYPIPTLASLAVVAGVLGGSIALSLAFPDKNKKIKEN